MSAPSTGPGGRALEPVVLVEPRLWPRLSRLCAGPPAFRVEWNDRGGAGARRRKILACVDWVDTHRLRDDPLLDGATLRFAVNRREWAAGDTERLDLEDPISAASTPVAARRLGPVAPVTRPFPPPERLLPRRQKVGTRWRRRSAPPRAEALWVPDREALRLFRALCLEPRVSWQTLSVRRAGGGFVLEGGLPRRVGSPLLVPLTKHILAGGEVLYTDSTLEVSRGLDSLPGVPRAGLLLVDGGRVRWLTLEEPPVEAALLVAPRARPGPAERAATPKGEAPKARERRAEAVTEVVDWMREDREGDPQLRAKIREAFSGPTSDVAPPPAGGARRGWLRYFLPRRLPAVLRRRLDRAARAEIEHRAGRQKVAERQRNVLTSLLKALAGPDWRDGLSLALPLSPPGERDRGEPWINAFPSLTPRPAGFSLDAAADKSALGAVPVGEEIYRQFEEIYRRAAARLVAERAWRHAAHVYSYLLGDHARAATVLEQGAFYREAATVHYHLADRPRKSAVALERGGLHDEAARIWMDLGRWREAARAWARSGNRIQEEAAWRKLVMDLRQAGRFLEAATILEERLREPYVAFEILEQGFLALGRSALEALERLLRSALAAGETERARHWFGTAREVLLESVDRTPRRATLRRLVRWARRVADWSRTAPLDRLVSVRDCRLAWQATARTWARSRHRAHSGLRLEMDSLVADVARRTGEVCDDPWLRSDAERWLSAGVEAGETPTVVTADECQLPARAGALCGAGERLLAGTLDGDVLVLSAARDVVLRLETGTARPVGAVHVHRQEVYCAVDDETFHFTVESFESAGARRTPRALQVERSLEGTIQDLVGFPDGSGVLRVTTRQVHVLHPVHLQAVERVVDAAGRSIAGAAANREFVAVLLNHGRSRDTRAAGSFEVLVFQRRRRQPGNDLRLVERFGVDMKHPRRLIFLDLDGDDLLLVGEEFCAHLPSRRADVRYHELEVGTLAGRLPAARAASVPAHRTVLLAYGNGALEALHLARGDTPARRRFLCDAPGGKPDPVAGLAVAAKPLTAWLLHASGHLREFRGLDATLRQLASGEGGATGA